VLSLARSRGFVSRSRGPRRKLSWTIGVQTGTDGSAQVLSSTSSQVFTGAAVVALDGTTLVRTRGEFLIFLKSATTAAAGFHGAFGIGVGNTAAVAAGVGSIPTPIDEENWDGWLYHRYFSCISHGVIDGTVSNDGDAINATSAAVRIEVDSKAMRKLSIEQTVFGAIQVLEAGTATAEFFFNSRQLVKLA